MVRYNFKEHYRGDTFNARLLTFRDSQSNPINLTGLNIKMQFRKNTKTGRLVKELSIGSGITITNAAGGEIQTDSFQLDWEVGTYYYDIQQDNDGNIKTLFEGTLPIIQDVTT